MIEIIVESTEKYIEYKERMADGHQLKQVLSTNQEEEQIAKA